MNEFRIAAFGFRSLPPKEGSAGADKFAMELYPRLVAKGCTVLAYNRLYANDEVKSDRFKGVHLKYFRTVRKSGFDSLLHSLKATCHIISRNTADIIHIHNGGNSLWALPLRAAGKKVFVSQDGVDWKREKWSWYGKLFLYLSSYITAYIPNDVIFDNIYSKNIFEKKFGRRFRFIPYGNEVEPVEDNSEILSRLGLTPQGYFLFVGRFIPDKGLHYLIEAFTRIHTDKKLVLVGGSPIPSSYEVGLRKTDDPRIIFPGYIYGNDTNVLMKHAYCYIQPSDVEGLSPVILTVMGLGTPIICSNIEENVFVVGETALTFIKSDSEDLREKISFALAHGDRMQELSRKAFARANEMFSWDTVVAQHIDAFTLK